MRELEPSPFEKKTFPQLMTFAKNWKNELRALLPQTFSKLGVIRPDKNRLSVIAIGTLPGTSHQTIFATSIPLEVMQRAQEGKRPLELTLQPIIRHDPFVRQNPPSAEFSLMCERQRAHVTTGVVDYEVKGQNMLLLAGDQLFRFTPRNERLEVIRVGQPQLEPMDVSDGSIASQGTKGCSVQEHTSTASSSSFYSATKSAPESTSNFVSSAKACPSDEKFIAYVLNKQVYVEKDDRVIYRTSSSSKHITNGVPSYIVQEELERFDGIWWSPTHRRLLYEHVNEEMVQNVHFGINGEGSTMPMKYPKAGKTNALSTLRMVLFENDKVYDVALKPGLLQKHCPSFEYITRAGFFSDGTTVWVQLMSRDQSECTLLLIPVTDFELPRELRGDTPPTEEVQLSTNLNMGTWNESTPNEEIEKLPRGKIARTVVIHKARSDFWINVHNATYPLKITDEEQPLYEFIYCLDKPNGSCIALISAELDENGYHRHTEEKLLMAETHSIHKSMNIVVDEKRELVYYVANESHPTEWNICVSHYRSGKTDCLTERGISFKTERAHNRLAIDLDHGICCWMNSLATIPRCVFYSFRWTEGEVLPKTVCAAEINFGGKHETDGNYDIPEMIEYVSKRTGLVHYALVLRPENFDANKKYPVLHYVYGGPGIQLVHNDYTWVQWLRFCRLGYVVVMLDNRGSANRGIEFERHLSKKMGTIEVEDQVEGLQMLAEKAEYMDMSRVIVHGWSYGGYMSLHLIAKHPAVYRAAIAGGCVSDWRMYDTAYTERYLGYPVQDHVYGAASVEGLIEKLPDEPNRLMLIHGLMDENVHVSHLTSIVDQCVKAGKWHELLLFPHERHGIRNNDASIYLDARMMYFAQRAIQGL